MWTSEEIVLLIALGDTRGFCPECRGEQTFERPPRPDGHDDFRDELICSGCAAAFLDGGVPFAGRTAQTTARTA